jgi:hypothetical protein
MTVVGWLRRLFTRSKPPSHDLWLDGVMACVSRVYDDGKRISVYGWYDFHWKLQQGHLVRFLQREGAEVRPSTYRIVKDKHCGDPPDMYFLECEYVGGGT